MIWLIPIYLIFSINIVNSRDSPSKEPSTKCLEDFSSVTNNLQQKEENWAKKSEN